eukprot:gnl/Dysnectes_brevis/1628_a1853_1160.p1 GENE.gnl/Dysnectes_brevis/1628_a1853_1160~~gnl/Dysnectes_brevis/1628_a1853_1160.p1  ORF type:complete len:854 (+),score=61.97 gnl/Dysnectes_brevis/1628_a1853_1160:1786-4347(+)
MNTLFCGLLLLLSVVFSSPDVCSLTADNALSLTEIYRCFESIYMTQQDKDDLFRYIDDVLDSYALRAVGMHVPAPFNHISMDLAAEVKKIQASTTLQEWPIHRQLSDLFLSLQDGHTVYISPDGFDFIAFIPLLINVNTDESDNIVYTVTSLSYSAESLYLDVYPDSAADLLTAKTDGQTIELINGMPVRDFILDVGNKRGANLSPGGSFNTGIESVMKRTRSNFPEADDLFTLTFTNSDVVSLPWAGLLGYASNDTQSRMDLNSPASPTSTSTSVFTAEESVLASMGLLVKSPVKSAPSPLLEPSKQQQAPLPSTSDYDYTKTTSSDVDPLQLLFVDNGGIIGAYLWTDSTTGTTTGILRYPSFTTPTSYLLYPDFTWLLDALDALAEHAPDYLVIDLRGNPGGNAMVLPAMLYLLGQQRSETTGDMMVFPKTTEQGMSPASGLNNLVTGPLPVYVQFASHSDINADNIATHTFRVQNTESSQYATYSSSTVVDEHWGYVTFSPQDYYNEDGELYVPPIRVSEALLDYQLWKQFSPDELAILTDLDCYSACSILSHMVKERGLAKVINLGGLPDTTSSSGATTMQNIVGGATGGPTFLGSYLTRITPPPRGIEIAFLWGLLIDRTVEADIADDKPADPDNVPLSSLLQYTTLETDYSVLYWPNGAQTDTQVLRSVMPEVSQILGMTGSQVHEDDACMSSSSPEMVYGRLLDLSGASIGQCLPIYCGDRYVMASGSATACVSQPQSVLYKVERIRNLVIAAGVFILLVIIGSVVCCCMGCCCCDCCGRKSARKAAYIQRVAFGKPQPVSSFQMNAARNEMVPPPPQSAAMQGQMMVSSPGIQYEPTTIREIQL